MFRSKKAAQAPKEVQIVEAYLTVSMALLNEVGLEPTEKAGVQVFVLGLVDMLRQVKELNWDQFIAAYESVLSNHNLMPSVPVGEFVKSVGATASENANIDSLMRLAAQSISLYVSKGDVGAPDDLLSAPRFANDHAASFADLCESA